MNDVARIRRPPLAALVLLTGVGPLVTDACLRGLPELSVDAHLTGS